MIKTKDEKELLGRLFKVLEVRKNGDNFQGLRCERDDGTPIDIMKSGSYDDHLSVFVAEKIVKYRVQFAIESVVQLLAFDDENSAKQKVEELNTKYPGCNATFGAFETLKS
jgi:hypothetical protein